MRIEDEWPFAHPDKLQLFSLNTPNGVKIGFALEELELDYEAHRIDIMTGDQHKPAFLTVSPNGKIPAIVDPNGPGGERLELAESGAILLWLAEKTGRLLPSDPIERLHTIQWTMTQVGHLGPMFGQFGHFHKFARETCDHPYPLDRYRKESKRLLGVLEAQLGDGRKHLMGDDLTIADVASVPWVEVLGSFYEAAEELELSRFERVNAWVKRVTSRPAYARGKDVTPFA